MHPRSRFVASGHSGVDGESLQADVMRFMAIIGFCLVAIMALVRDVNPPGAQPVSSPRIPSAEPVPEPAPVAAIKPRLLSLPDPVVEKARIAREPPVVVVTKPQTRPKLVQQAKRPTPAAQKSRPRVPQPAVAAAEPAVEPDEGLSLRFNSDRDFLRLITSGEVDLYLFKDQTSFRLAKNYAFLAAPAPRQLYELLPQTIPSAINASAETVVSNTSLFKWGVVMPEHIERRIASLVAVESSGQLVIDRFGIVRHETSTLGKGPDRATISGGQG